MNGRNRTAVVLLILGSLLALFPRHASAQQPIESPRKIVTRVVPQYPSLARSMNIQGSVKADVLVAPNGTVKSVEVKGGHPLFAQAAQNALREWKWEPGPHETNEIVELRFSP
ncbi:MAG: energy transducer TonB [Candidatus Sulfotelmatobacter sp.]